MNKYIDTALMQLNEVVICVLCSDSGCLGEGRGTEARFILSVRRGAATCCGHERGFGATWWGLVP